MKLLTYNIREFTLNESESETIFCRFQFTDFDVVMVTRDTPTNIDISTCMCQRKLSESVTVLLNFNKVKVKIISITPALKRLLLHLLSMYIPDSSDLDSLTLICKCWAIFLNSNTVKKRQEDQFC